MADYVDKEKEGDLGIVDSVNAGEITSTYQPNEIKRELKPRQVFMFSIACAIGTGLVIGSGSGLSRGGPGSLFLAYCTIGITVFFVMTAMGEMAAFLPMNKGFAGYATRMVDPAFGFATGWNYFFKYLLVTPTNLTAAGLVIQYWRPDLNVAIWITVFGILIITINHSGGGPDGDRKGFRYWNEPGAFAEYLFTGPKGRFLGWWACMVQACFAFTGCEVVGMTFGETPNPRKNVPIAVRQTFWRIAGFYVFSSLVLGMAIPFNNEKLIGATKQATSGAASPFVVAVSISGVKVFPDIINGCLLVFTLSGASSDIYCSSRTLYGLAKDGQAPEIFSRTRLNGNPVWAVVVPSAFVALGYLNSSKSSSQVFGYFVSVVTVFAVLNWVAILVSHIQFRRALKAQNIPLSDLPYTGLMQPYGTYFALFISVLIVIFSGYDAFIPTFKVDVFIMKYIGIVIFAANVMFWKVFQKTDFCTPSTVDLITGRREFEIHESAQDQSWNSSFFKKLVTAIRRR